jgi:predicted protein tyrosine phosphatase
MTHPKLTIFGYSEAAMFLRGTPKPSVTAIISIHGGREFGIEADVRKRLDLTFDDVEVVADNDIDSMQRAMSRKRWSEQNGLVEVAPVASDAESIIKFTETLRGTEGIVLCHCGGGMSRAPAAALICLSIWRGGGTETECVANIFRVHRGAVPHFGLVRFADNLLGRNGRLVEALLVAAQR